MTQDELHVILDSLNLAANTIADDRHVPWDGYEVLDGAPDPKTNRSGYLYLLRKAARTVEAEMTGTLKPKDQLGDLARRWAGVDARPVIPVRIEHVSIGNDNLDSPVTGLAAIAADGSGTVYEVEPGHTQAARSVLMSRIDGAGRYRVVEPITVDIPGSFHAIYEDGVIVRWVFMPAASYAGYFGPSATVEGDSDLETGLGGPFWEAVRTALGASADGSAITVQWRE